MTARERMTVAAGIAVCLCTASLAPMYDSKSWGSEVFGAIGVVFAAGLLGRRLSLPRLLQPVFGLLALAAYLVLVFAGATLTHGVVPTSQTVDLLRQLVDTARADISRYRAPVPTSTGMVLLSAAGVGAVAVLVDLFAVTLQRAALAGLPLLVLFAVPAAVVPGGVGSLSFVLCAAGWLLILMVEGHEVVERWGSMTAQGAPIGESSLGRLGRRIGVGALGVAVVVPLLVPGLNKTLVGGNAPGGEGDGRSSSAHTYNPITRLQSQLTLPDPVRLFEYRTNDPSPDYVRMTTLDRYDGRGWSASALSQKRDGAQVQNGIKAPVDDGGPHQSLTMQIAMDGAHLDVYWLPLPYGPTQVDVKGTWLWDPASQTAFSASRTTKNLPEYTVRANRVLPDRATLSAARSTDVDVDVRAQYGSDIQVTPSVLQQTESIVAGQAGPYAKAVALQEWFTQRSNGFVYDLTPPRGHVGEDPLEAFLRLRRGFCEQYATAMAAMLRVAGIPSRVAVGFTRGEPLKGDQSKGERSYRVTTHDAHAWPEAWFAGTGWVRFEPTPGESGSTVPDYTLAGQALPAPGQSPGTATPTPSASSTARGAIPEEDLLGNQNGSASAKNGSGSRWLVWSLVAVALIAAAAAPGLLTVLRRRRRWRRPDPLIAWEQLREDAGDIGHVWQSSDSPRAAAARLRAQRRLPTPADEALERIAVAAERARFALPGATGQSGSLVRDVETVRTALRSTCTRWVRWRAQVCPPSTMRWATDGAGDLLEGTSVRIEDRVSRLTRRWRRT
ncbi:MAG: transglutaminase domain protein [Frankiales bacterium]|nr:transglutaminase domain protein [Frankiales bacterium]